MSKEIETKFTRDGKKVAVIGKLNSTQWIVQEIFVAEGQEFPSGDSFVETCLLDKPAETYTECRIKEAETRMICIEAEIATLNGRRKIAKRDAQAADMINAITSKYADADISQLQTLVDFMCGNITHLIVSDYLEHNIIELRAALESTDSWHGDMRFEGLRLVSLFGVHNGGVNSERSKSMRLDWKLHKYTDVSGGFSGLIIPCTSYETAIAELETIARESKSVTSSLIEAKEKYGLSYPTNEQVREYNEEALKEAKKGLATEELKLKSRREKVAAQEMALKEKG